MQIIFKYHNCRGFGRLYNDAIKQKYMITKEAKQRLKILEFWKKHGLQATIDAYGAKRSTLYYRQGHIEKFNRSIQEEFIDWQESYFDNLDDFNNLLIDQLLWYNTRRPY